MRRFAFAVALFALTCTAAAQQPNSKTKTDLELIQGTWRIVGLESGGKQQSDKGFNGNTFTFSKVKTVDTAVLTERLYPPVEFTLTLDSTKTPKTIDLTTRGNTARGIYKLEGDDLTICMSLGGQHPTEFTTKPGGDTETFALKRNRWERHSEKGLGFSIDFPGKPTESKRDFDTPTGKVTATVLTMRSEMERVSYTVTVIPLPGKLNDMDIEATLDAAQKAMLAEIDQEAKPRVESEAKVLKAPAGVSAAREFTIAMQPAQSKDRGAMRVRLYVAGERLYVFAVGGQEEATKSQNATRFWNSFRTPADKRKDPPGK